MNALKLLNEKGEFISDEIGKASTCCGESGEINFAEVDKLEALRKQRLYQKTH
jgi:phosphomannomutase